MTDVKRKTSDTTAEVGTVIEVQGLAVVVGVDSSRLDGEVLPEGFPYEAYQDTSAMLRDGWVPR